jgi:hypothetical protein
MPQPTESIDIFPEFAQELVDEYAAALQLYSADLVLALLLGGETHAE